MRRAVEHDVHQAPVYRALSVIRTGLLPDGTVPPYGTGKPIKLSKAAITREYSRELADQVKQLRPYVYSAEGGVHPDTVAELFEFASGQALLEAIVQAKPMTQVIDATADARMREKHGDLMLDGLALNEAAESAVYDQRAKIISAELKALSQGLSAKIPSTAALNAQAVATINRTPVRELNPGRYLAAARRASKAAFDAFSRNDRKAAVEAKQVELAALAHWRAARDAKERAEKIRTKLTRYASHGPTRARIGKAGQAYLDQIDGFLDRYQFAKASNKVLDRRDTLRAFVAKVEADGLPNPIPAHLLDELRVPNWRELPVEELQGVATAVDQIAHLARLKNKLLTARNQKELAEARTEIEQAIRDYHAKRDVPNDSRSDAARRAAQIDGWFMSHRKIASLARELDGFKDGGPMWEYTIRPLNEAANREATMTADATQRLSALYATHYTAAERRQLRKQEWVEALGPRDKKSAKLSRENRLMIALNWGNETNRKRVRDGRGWSDTQITAILDGLDKRDWQFVQDVWDFVNSYWPEIAAKEQRVKGVAPRKEDAIPVFTRHGEFRGGYFPLMWDRSLSTKVVSLEEASAADMAKAAAYLHNVTDHGHTKERVEGTVTLPIRLDFGVIFEHTQRVIHDLTHHEALVDVGRVLDGQVGTAILDTLGPKAYDQFRRALHAIAVGDVGAMTEVEGSLGMLRVGATIAGLGWSFSTAALQPLGLTQSMKRIGVGHTMRGLKAWLTGRSASGLEASVASVMAKSEYMRNRMATQNRELNEVRNVIKAKTPAQELLEGSFFVAITKMQLVADMPTWLGQYEKSLSTGASEEDAIALADQAVIDSQGGGQQKDLAAVQRGGPAWKMWTNFYSFFNTTYNLWAESTHQARVERSPAAVAHLAVDAMLLFVVPAVLGHFLRSALTGDLLDELEDPEELAKALALEGIAYMTGPLIGVREIGGLLQGYGGYEGPAGSRAFSATGKLIKQVEQLELDEAFWRSLNAAAGVYFHYPAAQVDKTVRGILALVNGDTSNPLAPLAGPGKPK